MTANKAKAIITTDLPPPGWNVVVQCEGFRCLAYRTPEGKWMPAFGRDELPRVTRVYPFEQPSRYAVPVEFGSRAPRTIRIPIHFRG